MSRFIAISLLCLSTHSLLSQQGVKIAESPGAPHPSAALDVEASQQGFLLPRVADPSEIINPATGLQVFNTTTNCLQIYIPPVWQNIYCGCQPPAAPSSGVHQTTSSSITWNWNAVNEAVSYRVNSSNDFASASSINGLSWEQTGLACGQSYSVYVWAVSSCGNSTSQILSASTGSCVQCGPGHNLTDIDGNVYETVLIGTQCWMKQNLNVTRNASGGAINRYCHVCPQYGGHYDWATVMGGSSSSNSNPSGVQGICPTGWHLPSQSEYQQMVTYLKTNGFHCGSNTDWVAKSIAIGSGWASNPWADPDNCTPANNQAANNSSGFSMVGGGYWNPTMSQYYQSAQTIVANIHEGYLLTATQSSASDAVYFRIGQYYYEPSFTDYTKNGRANVRCVKN